MVSLGCGVLLWFVDPRGLWEWWRCRRFVDEPFGVGLVGGVEDSCPLRLDGFGPVVVDVCGGVVSDTGVAVFVVVPVEEAATERLGVFEGPEPFREGGSILHRLELRLRIRVVVRDVWPGMGFGDPEIADEQSNRFGRHRRSPVGVDRQGAPINTLCGDRVGEEPLSEMSPLGTCEHPAGYVAAVD